MAIPSERAHEILQNYQTDRIANLFAQSSARQVLYEVGESEKNFPKFDSALSDKVTSSAYSILSAGVSLLETELDANAMDSIEEAATLLNNVHGPLADKELYSSFHVLIAAMAFHVSGQYSRAFVCIRKVEMHTNLAQMIASFIRKQPDQVISAINQYLLENLSERTDHWLLCDHAVTLSISRALSLVLEYFATGDLKYLESTEENINIAIELSIDYESPSHWWIARLLKLMISGNCKASLWNVLPLYFPGTNELLERYIKLLNFAKYSITELWRSQLEAIPIVFKKECSGAVINMRTSSGKTRIAEIAILRVLHDDPDAKILYLAPFRSLAMEIEQTLGQIFDWCGFQVSHLYGGFRVSSADKKMAESASITIATPEKARAILRSSPELLDDVKLIIIDEGHLIGANERYVKNELFVDHLKALGQTKGSRILMLSAVLPNPNDLASWLTGDQENVAKSNWKPSTERFGILAWQGNRVRIDWKGDFESFNPRFVQSKPLGWGRRRNLFPNNKNEAVAASAIRLSKVGPVMIFSARANSIPGLAKAVLMAMGEHPEEYVWPDNAWNAFLATCEEELSEDAIELKSARHGIICHSNKLPSQVRMATERLMRSVPPKIIIASSTLAQGVNIGVSSVIVSTPYQTQNPIDHRDFWNICGRAGRAFVDGEGKILYAIDETRKAWQVRKDYELAKNYFDHNKGNSVESGLLYVIGIIHKVALDSGIDFEQLLTMVAENDFSKLGEDNAAGCLGIMDLIDDGLMALHEDQGINLNSEEPEAWVDDVFRTSLAAIQAEHSQFSLDTERVIRFIRARVSQVIGSTPDPEQRKAYVASGLPISTASNIFKDRGLFLEKAQIVLDSELSLLSVCDFVAWLEEWARINATIIVENLPEKNILDLIRMDWIFGSPMRKILESTDEADKVCKNIYGYQFPWLIHAAGQQIKQMGNEELSEILSTIALLVELGIPSEEAAWIFLAGIRSRASATELSNCSIDLGNSSAQVRKKLRKPDIVAELRNMVSDQTQAWLDLHWSDSVIDTIDIPTFPKIRVKQFPDSILVRSYNQNVYLCSPDGRQRISVKVTEKLPFDTIVDDYRFMFKRETDEIYRLVTRDPRIKL